MNNQVFYFKGRDPFDNKIILYQIFDKNFSHNTKLNPKEITKEEFDYFSNLSEKERKEQDYNISIKEKLLVKKDDEIKKNAFTPYQLYQYYYYYYAKWIWQLINLRGCSYKWLNINNYKFNKEEVSKKSAVDWNDMPNFYLQQYNHQKQKLGEDIITNGMYFPFFIATDNTTDIIPIIFGKHRLYALELNLEKIKDKEFLFIQLPHGYDFFSTFISDQENPYQSNFITCNYINSRFPEKIYEYQTNDEKRIFLEFVDICEKLPSFLFHYRDIIKSNPIFNNKEKWEQFINNPFDEKELLTIQNNYLSKG